MRKLTRIVSSALRRWVYALAHNGKVCEVVHNTRRCNNKKSEWFVLLYYFSCPAIFSVRQPFLRWGSTRLSFTWSWTQSRQIWRLNQRCKRQSPKPSSQYLCNEPALFCHAQLLYYFIGIYRKILLVLLGCGRLPTERIKSTGA